MLTEKEILKQLYNWLLFTIGIDYETKLPSGLYGASSTEFAIKSGKRKLPSSKKENDLHLSNSINEDIINFGSNDLYSYVRKAFFKLTDHEQTILTAFYQCPENTDYVFVIGRLINQSSVNLINTVINNAKSEFVKNFNIEYLKENI